ncbi:MAG: holo-ACP synthase [Actinomycetales bacterium]|nr:holo-ACP synthase [Actinomycetales bacterium]
MHGVPAAVVGIGVDIVDLQRFAGVIERTPRLVDRVFTRAESHHLDGTRRSAASLAARFAAKEAVAKVLVQTHGLQWHHCEVIVEEHGNPRLRLTGTVAAAAQERGIDAWHLSLSHDACHAIAYVVAQGARADS